MRLDHHESLRRLASADHAILGTRHEHRGVDLVPVVFAVVDDHIGVPIDVVKPKSSTSLQRESNLDDDPRASLLVEHWSADEWDTLWWVRATLERVPESPPGMAERLERSLATKHWQYAERPFVKVIEFRIVSLSGWSAGE